MTNSTSTPGSKVGRARRSLGQLWQAPVFLIGLLAFVGVAASTPWRLTPQEREFEQFVKALRQGLESDETGDVLLAHADNVKLRLPRFPSRAAEAEFLIGSAYYRHAAKKPAAHAKDLWPRAVEHLDKALTEGVAPADRPALQYRLGYCLYQQNIDLPRALELMTLGVEKGAEQPLQAYQLLVKAHLNRQPPDLDAARSAVRRVLDLTPERDIEAVATVRLQYGELLMRKEMRAEAIKEFERVGPKASRALRIRARLLQARCQEEDGHWNKAIPIWQELNADAALVDGGKARIAYALGCCYHQMEPQNIPAAVQAWSEAVKLGGLEGQAAGLRLGQLRLAPMTNEPTLALADWKAALENVNQPKDYKNPYLAIELVRQWFDSAIDHFQAAHDPEKTQFVAELYRKIAPGGVAEDRLAHAAEARAKQLADKLKAKHDNVSAAEVAAQYRRAGEAWEQAAGARVDAERPEALWRGIQCHLLAKDNARAQQILDKYVRMEINENRLAEAWFILGDLYRLDGQKSVAHQAYVKCIQYPRTPFAYRARFWLAVEEEVDNKNFEKACVILQDNLSNPSSDVERDWLEKSAFKMASLLMKLKSYGVAHVHLKECLNNFPENPNAMLAREQLGECYRKLAEKERLIEKALDIERSAGVPPERLKILDERIRQQRLKRVETLLEAVKVFQGLADELEKTRSSGKPLTKLEQILLCRARFGLGECYYDNEHFDEAKVIFFDLQRKHRGTLEGLVASFKVCNMVELIRDPPSRALDIRETAKESVRMVIEDLKTISPDDDMFRLPDVSPHNVWLSWAQKAQRTLSEPPAKDGVLGTFP